MPRPRTWTDEDVKAAVALSDNLAQVCRALGISPGKRTYSLLHNHITRLSLDTTHFGTAPHRRVANGQPWTEEDLAAAVELSPDLRVVCDLLDLPPGSRTYESLRRHIARLGLDATHLPKVERRGRSGRVTDDDLRTAISECSTVSAVLRWFGYKPSGGMHRYIQQRIANLGLDTSHFVGQGWLRGRTHTNNCIPLEEILVKNSTYMGTSKLRQRLIAEGLKEAKCECCGIDSWLGQPLPLALDHINGDHTDNRLENLRILCPNCHALTPTWCGRRNGESKQQRH